MLALQHGTTARDAEAPSNEVAASKVPVVLASTGYIVLAPDYVGYGSSKGQPHPYLLAAPSASVVVDLLTAAKYWRQTTRRARQPAVIFGGLLRRGLCVHGRSPQPGGWQHQPACQKSEPWWWLGAGLTT